MIFICIVHYQFCTHLVVGFCWDNNYDNNIEEAYFNPFPSHIGGVQQQPQQQQQQQEQQGAWLNCWIKIDNVI